MTTFKGATKGEIGNLYDVALGLDDGSGTVDMMGYVLSPNTKFEAGTRLRDTNQLVQVASPHAADARDVEGLPKVSQSDWSQGERTLFYGVQQSHRYYISDGGVDPSWPGQLRLLPGTSYTTTLTSTGHINPGRTDTDGTDYWVSVINGSYNIWQSGDRTYQTVCGGGELYDIVAGDNEILVCTANAVWSIGGASGTPVQTQIAGSEAIPTNAHQWIAKYQNQYLYIGGAVARGGITAQGTDGFDLKYKNVGVIGSGAGILAKTFAQPIRCIAAGHNGLLVSTSWGMNNLGFHNTDPAGTMTGGGIPQSNLMSNLYRWDGQNADLIDSLRGEIVSITQVKSIAYILLYTYQSVPGACDYTLWKYDGLHLGQPLDDTRWLIPEFRSKLTGLDQWFHPSMTSDERFLYIGWPGLPGVRYDLTQGGVTRIGNTDTVGQDIVHGHTVMKTAAKGIVDVAAIAGNVYIHEHAGAPISGQITSAYYDFDSSGSFKRWQSIEVDLAAPMPTSGTVRIQLQIDDAVALTDLGTGEAKTTTRYVYRVPRGVKGKRIRLIVTISNPGADAVGPAIRLWAVRAGLSRTWKMTLNCRRNLQQRNGANEKRKSIALISNIMNAYATGGYTYMTFPSPGVSGNVEGPVPVLIDDYTWHLDGGVSPTFRVVDNIADFDGDVDVTVVESN